MKKMLFAATAAIIVPVSAGADVTVKFPAGQKESSFLVEHMLTADMVKNRAERPEASLDTIAVVDGVLKFGIDSRGGARYMIPVSDNEAIQFFTSPGDNLTVDVNSLSPLKYTVSGSPLMDGIFSIKPREEALLEKYRSLHSATPLDTVAVNDVIKDYNNLFIDYVKENPAAPASLYAIARVDGQEFIELYDLLSPELASQPLYPLIVKQKESVEKSIEAEKRQQALQTGHMEAPGFTFKNIDGKDVSLSDFRGKWVILDFWGGWCPWCIKGFPKLKDAYEQYKPELEIIGIDCNESEEAWRKAVAKYELPWVNVYNPLKGTETGVLLEYGVQGFPTKAIIDPEGKIVNITVGEDPSFFETLGRLINGK